MWEPTLLTGLPIQETDPVVFIVIEKWESREALEAHLAAPPYGRIPKTDPGYGAGVSVKILVPI